MMRPTEIPLVRNTPLPEIAVHPTYPARNRMERAVSGFFETTNLIERGTHFPVVTTGKMTSAKGPQDSASTNTYAATVVRNIVLGATVTRPEA